MSKSLPTNAATPASLTSFNERELIEPRSARRKPIETSMITSAGGVTVAERVR